MSELIDLARVDGVFDPHSMARHLLRAAAYLRRNPHVQTFSFDVDADLAEALAKFLTEAQRPQ